MPKYLKNCKGGASKKSRTSETTSHGTSDSAHFGLNLNNEADDSEDVEIQEVRPIGRDKSKKKAPSSTARGEHGAELELDDLRRREQAKFERLKLAHE
ncbi:hypothetical protein Tco_0176498 [Tanacetum coccineum]